MSSSCLDNNDKFLILNKININNSDTFKKSIQNQLEEAIKEKKRIILRIVNQ